MSEISTIEIRISPNPDDATISPCSFPLSSEDTIDFVSVAKQFPEGIGVEMNICGEWTVLERTAENKILIPKDLLQNDDILKVSIPIQNSRKRANSVAQQTGDEYISMFLIQLQHREITPEDYEDLTRLDERIKKKTMDEEILKKLRTETIQETEDEDGCGICLDSYLVGQTVKYLPCGHRFHSDCIDNWLKNQSVNCPLDNLPIDMSIEKDVLAVMNTVLIGVEDKLVLDDLLGELLDKVADDI